MSGKPKKKILRTSSGKPNTQSKLTSSQNPKPKSTKKTTKTNDEKENQKSKSSQDDASSQIAKNSAQAEKQKKKVKKIIVKKKFIKKRPAKDKFEYTSDNEIDEIIEKEAEQNSPAKCEKICATINEFISEKDNDNRFLHLCPFVRKNILLFISFYIYKYDLFSQFKNPNAINFIDTAIESFIKSGQIDPIDSRKEEETNTKIDENETKINENETKIDENETKIDENKPVNKEPEKLSQDLINFSQNLKAVVEGMKGFGVFYIDVSDKISFDQISEKLTAFDDEDLAREAVYSIVLQFDTESSNEDHEIPLEFDIYNKRRFYPAKETLSDKQILSKYHLEFAIGKQNVLFYYRNNYILFSLNDGQGSIEVIQKDKIPNMQLLTASYIIEHNKVCSKA